MNPYIKTTLLLLALIIAIAGLAAFTQPGTPSIVGIWTQFEVQTLTKRSGASSADTVIKYDRQYTVSFTADSQYRYTGPRLIPAPGRYMVSGDMLRQSSSVHSGRWLKIVSLSDHKLLLQEHKVGIESGIVTETTITYKK